MRRSIVILLALLLAVGGAGLMLWYVGRADDRALAGEQPITVYVTKAQVPSGTTLRDAERQELIEKTQVAEKAVPTGALTEIDPDMMTLVALSDVSPGEVLLSNRFGDTPTGTKAIEVPSGKLAMSIELGDPQRVGTFVTPGSHIVIYRTSKLVPLGDTPRDKVIRENEFTSTEVVLADALVIGMGDDPLAAPRRAAEDEDDDNSGGVAGRTEESFLVTVAVTPEQALLLVHTAQNFSMWSALRGSDVEVDPKSEVNDLTWTGGLP